jgi:hypothetical protein
MAGMTIVGCMLGARLVVGVRDVRLAVALVVGHSHTPWEYHSIGVKTALRLVWFRRAAPER